VEIGSHPQGTFCFPELNTRDVEAAKRFYSTLLGWTAFDVPSAAGSYSLARVSGHDVAGIHLSSRGEPAWLCYVAVDSADRMAARAVELGGVVRVAPFDVHGVGRMAMIEDPARAGLALWEPKGMIGVRLADEPGAPCWYELITHDLERATRFYVELFGWNTSERKILSAGPYTVARLGERSVAGLMRIRTEWGVVTPRWQAYFAVADCAETVRRARALGARVITGPNTVPDSGTFAVLADTEDAVFCVLQLP